MEFKRGNIVITNLGNIGVIDNTYKEIFCYSIIFKGGYTIKSYFSLNRIYYNDR